jgi:hypothetical protein
MLRLGVPLLLLVFLSPAQAADPLSYVPDSVQLVGKIPQPRKFAEAITQLEATQQSRELAPVKAALESIPAKRFFQMLGHVERELGAKWPDLLDQIAGGGIAFGGHFANNAASILVIQGTDEKQSEKAYELLVSIITDELQRQGAPNKPKRATENGVEVTEFSPELLSARIGSAILVSNKRDFLAQSLRVAAVRKPGSIRTRKALADAEKLLPKDPLAFVWIDFASVKKDQAAQDFFANTRKDFLQTLVVGGTIDCLRRSDFVAAGLYQEKTGLRLAVRLPAGRSEFPPEFALHVPPEKGQLGSLPLLEPPGVVYSQSMYLDIGYYWKHRDKLINDEMRKQLEDGIANLNKVLPGSVKFGELLESWGAHHRGVVLNHDAMPYKTIPIVRFPAFGYVATMRDPKFATGVESSLRAAGLIASLQLGLKQSEVEYDGVTIVAYRFPENKPFPDDPDNIRFNFEPCFAKVDNQFVAASTLEACKKVIAEVRRTHTVKGSPAVWRGKAFAAGGAKLLYDLPDPLITDAILSGGLSLDEARKQVDAIGAWLKKLGTVRIEIDEAETEYKFDVVWTK